MIHKYKSLLENTIKHLEIMEEIDHRITFETLVDYVILQLDQRSKLWHNKHLVFSIAYVAWHSTDHGKNTTEAQSICGLHLRRDVGIKELPN